MPIHKTKTGWQLRMKPGGRSGRNIVRTFATKREAERYQAYIIHQQAQGKDWNPSADPRTLSDLIDLWYQYHGQNLKDGEGRKRLLEYASQALQQPKASTLTPEQYLEYRAKRIKQGITPATCNRELSYLKAVYSTLRKLQAITYHPLEHVPPLREVNRELSYLTPDQIPILLQAVDQSLNQDLPYVVRLCLATGARWSEAATITRSQILSDRVHYIETKSGKPRTVPVSAELSTLLLEANTRQARLFHDCYAAFRSSLRRSGIDTPQGQATHILRHTFASHFIQSGGNILVLQRLLGHSDITVTMRYAHLAPDHLSEALAHNPLSLYGSTLVLPDRRKKSPA